MGAAEFVDDKDQKGQGVNVSAKFWLKLTNNRKNALDFV
jgi:hypothetical protein